MDSSGKTLVQVMQSLAGKTGWNMSCEWPGGLCEWGMS